MSYSPEITALAHRAAVLTDQIDRTLARRDALARERAEVWAKAVAAGATKEQLARRAGVHKAQVAKAMKRYA